jgi:hypothetical protein
LLYFRPMHAMQYHPCVRVDIYFEYDCGCELTSASITSVSLL